jgi:hypothetical protein
VPDDGRRWFFNGLLAPNPRDAVPDDIPVHFDGGRIEISLEMSSISKMRPNPGNHRTDNHPAARHDITLDGPLDPRFGSENEHTGSP